MPNRFILEFMRTCIHDYALLICTSHTHATLRSEQSALVSWQSGFCNSKPSILLVVSGTSAPVSHKTLLTIINIQSFTKLSSNFRLFASKHHITCICFWTALEPYSTGTLTFYSGEGHSSVPNTVTHSAFHLWLQREFSFQHILYTDYPYLNLVVSLV